MKQGLAVFEISALGAALVVLDRISKAAPIRLLQAELNDNYGYVIKILGDPAALRAATESGAALAREMAAPCTTTIIDAPDKLSVQKTRLRLTASPRQAENRRQRTDNMF